jgi:hypothetical protein
MVLRWTAAAVLEAVKGYRRKATTNMPNRVAALRTREQQLSVVVSMEHVA